MKEAQITKTVDAYDAEFTFTMDWDAQTLNIRVSSENYHRGETTLDMADLHFLGLAKKARKR